VDVETMSNLLQQVSETLVDTLGLEDVSPQDITRETQFFAGGLGLDSIDVLELVVAIEQRWGVKIDNKELGQQVLVSVGSLIDYIEANRGGDGTG
jgi:acyl carrier protein